VRVVLLPGSTPSPWDGIEVYSYELGKSLARLGHEVIGLKIGERTGERRIMDNYYVRYVAVPRVRSALGYHLGFMLAALKEAKGLKTADVVHAVGGYYASIEFLPIRKIVTIIGASTLRESSSLRRRLRATYGRLLYKRALAYIVPNGIIAEEVKVRFGIKNVHVIPMGVDVDDLRPVNEKGQVREKYGFRGDDIIILYVGQLVRGKRLPELLTAFKKFSATHNRAKLLLLSWGYLKEELLKLTTTLGLEGKVIFMSPVPYQQRKDIYHLSDAFVMIGDSFGDGGISTALMDALAAGLPSVVAKNTANSIVVRDGINGFTVTPTAPEDVSKALESCLDEKERLSRNALEIARQYSWGNVAQKINEVYKTIL